MTTGTTNQVRPGTDVPAAIVPAAPYGPITVPYLATSTTSLSITKNFPRTFTMASKALAYQEGSRVRATSAASGAWMEGLVTSYQDYDLTIAMDKSFGSGTYADWSLNIAGEVSIEDSVPSCGFVFNANLTESHSGGAATFALKTLAGEDPSIFAPVIFVTRYGELRMITAPMSLTIPAGATFSIGNNEPFRLWFGLLDDGGYISIVVFQAHGQNNVIVGFPPNGVAPQILQIGPTSAGAGIFYGSYALPGATPFAILATAEYDSGLTSAGNWIASPTRICLFVPGSQTPGEIINEQFYTYGNSTNSTLTIPADNTIPQITEGAQVMGAVISPLSPASVIDVKARAIIADGSNNWIAGALFRTGLSNALGTSESAAAKNYYQLVSVRDFPKTTAQLTYTFRVGGSGSQQWTLNGSSGSRWYGGTFNSFFRTRERMT